MHTQTHAYQLVEAVLIEAALSEDVGRHDDVTRARIEECRGVVGGNAAPHLETAGESAERLHRGALIRRAGPKHDHVAALQMVLRKQLRKPARWLGGHKICLERRPGAVRDGREGGPLNYFTSAAFLEPYMNEIQK